MVVEYFNIKFAHNYYICRWIKKPSKTLIISNIEKNKEQKSMMVIGIDENIVNKIMKEYNDFDKNFIQVNKEDYLVKISSKMQLPIGIIEEVIHAKRQ